MKNETILISGATSGIGKATAELLARTGRSLILTGRRIERLEKLKSELEAKGASVFIASFDIRNRKETEKFVDSIPAAFRNIRVLINNAGLAAGLSAVQDGNPDDWDQMIDTNVKGLLYLSRAVIPLLEKVEGAQIVNVSSIAGKEVYPNGNVYCATKHAVDSLNKAMRIDLLPHKIKVTAIHPGAVDTEFSEVRFKGDKDRAKKVYEGYEPLHAQDIAEVIWFAASRPAHVNINDLLVMPSAQASTSHLLRE